MLRTLADMVGLILSGLLPRGEDLLRYTPRRLLVATLAAVILPPLMLYYWLGLWLDEVVFRGYRQVPVKRPVFILGVPRSGTTALHEILAQDPQFTTQRAWECVLAPSITHRYLWRAIARADQAVGQPLQALAGWCNRRVLAPLTSAHPLSGRAPEEDYLSLLPQLNAFILIVAFPNSRRLWQLGRADEALDDKARRRLMEHYRRTIQRHLYVHGTARIYLAKNASHAALVGSLTETFPDARFIACLREPEAVVSSQIASLMPAIHALHGPINQSAFNRRLTRQLHFAYGNLLSVLPREAPRRSVFLPLNAQRSDLTTALAHTYQQLGLRFSKEFEQTLKGLAPKTARYQSAHRHQLTDHGLSPATVQSTFAGLRSAVDFTAGRPISAAMVRPHPPFRRVVVVSDAAAERNGVGAYYSDLIDHLSDRVAEIRLIAPGRGIPHWWETTLPGDDTQSLALPSPRALYRAIADRTPHVIIVATPGPYGLLAAIMARRLGARLIFGLHTDYEALARLYWGGWLSRLNRWSMAAVNRIIFRRADTVVSNSAHMHALAQHKGAHRALRMHTPIPRAFLDCPAPPPQTPPRRVLFVGRLAAEKRIDDVIAAAQAHPRLEFSIAGDGPARDRVEAASRRLPNFKALGWVPRRALRAVLDQADLLVLPSTVEAFGTVALEAMVRGRLALVSPGCGIADWPEFEAGLMVIKPEETLTQALTRLLNHPPEGLRGRAAAGETAARAMALRCIDEWSSLIDQPTAAIGDANSTPAKTSPWPLSRT